METGVTASTLAGLLQVAYGRTPRTRSPLILELPRCGAHRTVLQLTEHDLTIFRQIAAEIESPELSTAFPTWKKAGITDPQLSLLRSLFVAIDGVVPYEYLAASGDPIVVPPDGDFRVEWVDRLSAPFLWLDLQQSDVCTEITPDGSGRMVYAYGDHLIPFSLLEEADLFPNLDQMAAWLNEPCAALHYRVPRFLLEESVHSLPQIRSAMRQARRNPGNSEQNTVTVQATY
jgi:hypothetical protein